MDMAVCFAWRRRRRFGQTFGGGGREGGGGGREGSEPSVTINPYYSH